MEHLTTKEIDKEIHRLTLEFCYRGIVQIYQRYFIVIETRRSTSENKNYTYQILVYACRIILCELRFTSATGNAVYKSEPYVAPVLPIYVTGYSDSEKKKQNEK